jgi:hypothetical protein|tara:strand:- start:104 stop:388 length:285 start_codon:yes stop_codon:yes gene_type:complete
MKIYAGKNKLTAKRTTLYDLIMESLNDAGFNTEKSGSFDGENHRWIEVNIRSKKPSMVSIDIGFDEEEDRITDIGVFESDIKTIIDTDNMKKIV